ncbi:MAG: MFS transporter [Chloroflexi bacterium]|nr:MFS transporter [Chloroflexota bacterium]
MRRQVDAILINRNHATFLIGSFIGATGSWVQAVALGWLAFQLGESGFVLGLVGFARMLPLLILAFPAGALGDRVSRRSMLQVSSIGGVLASAPLAIAVWLDVASIPLIVGLALANGIFDAMGWPVWSVFIRDLVGPERLRAAIAINSARFNLTRVLGPSVGGLILAAYGPAVCFTIAAIMLSGVFISILLLQLPPRPKVVAGPWLPAMAEGLRYAFGDPFVRRMMVITGGLGIFGQPYQHLLPAYASVGFGAGPEGLGLMMTAVGVGAIVGAALTGTRVVQRHSIDLIVWLPLCVTGALVLFGFAPLLGVAGWPVAVASLIAIGLFSIAHMSISNATLQLSVREDLVGRVMGLYTVVQAGVMPLGSLALGALVDAAGLTVTFVVGAAGTGLAAILFGRALLSGTVRPRDGVAEGARAGTSGR